MLPHKTKHPELIDLSWEEPATGEVLREHLSDEMKRYGPHCVVMVLTRQKRHTGAPWGPVRATIGRYKRVAGEWWRTHQVTVRLDELDFFAGKAERWRQTEGRELDG